MECSWFLRNLFSNGHGLGSNRTKPNCTPQTKLFTKSWTGPDWTISTVKPLSHGFTVWFVADWYTRSTRSHPTRGWYLSRFYYVLKLWFCCIARLHLWCLLGIYGVCIIGILFRCLFLGKEAIFFICIDVNVANIYSLCKEALCELSPKRPTFSWTYLWVFVSLLLVEIPMPLSQHVCIYIY
mgnify:CR=1 FL=1